MYVEIPENLTERTVILEFGADAYRFYQNRIEESGTGKSITIR